MPALAVFFGIAQTNFCLENDDGSLEFFDFPYAYSSELFANTVSSGAFYDEVISEFVKHHIPKTKVAKLDMLVCGFNDIPKLTIQPKITLSLTKALDSYEEFWPIFINNMCVITPKKFLSIVPTEAEIARTDRKLRRNIGGFTDGSPLDFKDYYANVSIYPEVVEVSTTAQIELDKAFMSGLVNVSETFAPARNGNVVFTGSRFSIYHRDMDLQYALGLDLLTENGANSLYLDNRNAHVLLALLKEYHRSELFTEKPYTDCYTKLGTHIRSAGVSEFLVDVGLGTPQILDIKEGELFVLPMETTSKARVTVKNVSTNTVSEYTVTGGKLGLILDTRPKDMLLTQNMSLLNNFVKHLSNFLTTVGV